MRTTSKMVAGFLAAALLASSPATAAGQASVAAARAAPNPWVMLSALSPVSAGVISGSAAAAAQPAADDSDRNGPGFPPIPVIGILLATLIVGIIIANHDNDNGGRFRFPNSPA